MDNNSNLYKIAQHPSKKVYKQILEHLNNGGVKSVLEVGAGYSSNFLTIFDNVVVIDIDQSKLNQVGAYGNIKKYIMSGNNLKTFSDNSFDLITCESTLDHIPNAKKAMEEFIRVSKKYILIGLGNNLISKNIGMYKKRNFTEIKPFDHLGHMVHFFYSRFLKFIKEYPLIIRDVRYVGWGVPSKFSYKFNSPTAYLCRHYFVLLEKSG